MIDPCWLKPVVGRSQWLITRASLFFFSFPKKKDSRWKITGKHTLMTWKLSLLQFYCIMLFKKKNRWNEHRAAQVTSSSSNNPNPVTCISHISGQINRRDVGVNKSLHCRMTSHLACNPPCPFFSPLLISLVTGLKKSPSSSAHSMQEQRNLLNWLLISHGGFEWRKKETKVE